RGVHARHVVRPRLRPGAPGRPACTGGLGVAPRLGLPTPDRPQHEHRQGRSCKSHSRTASTTKQWPWLRPDAPMPAWTPTHPPMLVHCTGSKSIEQMATCPESLESVGALVEARDLGWGSRGHVFGGLRDLGLASGPWCESPSRGFRGSVSGSGSVVSRRGGAACCM